VISPMVVRCSHRPKVFPKKLAATPGMWIVCVSFFSFFLFFFVCLHRRAKYTPSGPLLRASGVQLREVGDEFWLGIVGSY